MKCRAVLELRLIGAMLQDDPLQADLWDTIEADDFHESLLRAVWRELLKCKKAGLDYDPVEERIELEFPEPAGGVRRLLEYARSPLCAGVGAEAHPDAVLLALARSARHPAPSATYAHTSSSLG